MEWRLALGSGVLSFIQSYCFVSTVVMVFSWFVLTHDLKIVWFRMAYLEQIDTQSLVRT